MKAQQFFGGTKPKETGKDSTNRSNRTHSAGSVNTSGQLRPKNAPLTKTPLGRPTIKGHTTGKVGQ